MPTVLERAKNTKARTLLIFGLVIVIVIGIVIYLFTGGKGSSANQASAPAKIPTITAIPGGVTSERYQQLQEEENKRRAALAQKTGTSEVATIVGNRGKNQSASESFGIEDLLKKECKCPAVAGGCDPAKVAELYDKLKANLSTASTILRENPCLIKNLCSQNQDLAVAAMEKDLEAAKMLLDACPELAEPFAAKNPELFKKLMLDNPELARKLAAINPGLFKKLMLADPAFARALAKSNPELVKSLMANDPAFARALRAAVPGIDNIVSPPSAVAAVVPAQLSADQKNRLQALEQAMENQAKSAYDAWNTFNPQQFVQGDWAKKQEKMAEEKAKVVLAEQTAGGPGGAAIKGVLFKAGTVLYAALDTTVSSDEPSPILATVIEGPYRGSKLLGSFTASPQPGGLPAEKVIINFTTMNIPDRPASIPIQAVAIDPDTARTALATDVNNHYLLRYGTIFASAFLVGYAKVLTSMGTVQTSSANGLQTTTQSAQLSNRQQIFAALGQVGQKLGQSWEAYSTIPPTITVDSGTGVGILFLSDVSG